jgi:hypothetical protein
LVASQRHYYNGDLLFNAKWAIFTARSGCISMRRCCLLCTWVDMPYRSYSDTLSRFRANQSLLLFINVECFVEKQQIPILYSLL